MWKCKNCENTNVDSIYECAVCDSESPKLINLGYDEVLSVSEPKFLITWNIENADKLIFEDEIVDSKGSKEVKIIKNSKFRLKAINKFAERDFNIDIKLPKPEIISFDCSSEVISLRKAIKFSWNVKNSSQIHLSEYGDVSLLTEKDIFLNESKKVTLTVSNDNGKSSNVISLKLTAPEIELFEADNYTIVEGSKIKLKWKVTNAETLKLSTGEVIESLDLGEMEINAKSSTTIKLLAYNKTGNDYKDIKIVVIPKPKIKTLKVSSDTILLGKETELSWTVEDTEKIEVSSDLEWFDVTGKSKLKINPKKTTEYTLKAFSKDKIAITEHRILVKVIESVIIEDFKADTYFTIQSKPVTLYWKVRNADNIIILPSVGFIDKKTSIQFFPSEKTTYSIEASNELTKVRQELTIDVLPIPSISSFTISNVPNLKLNIPTYSLSENPITNTETPKIVKGEWYKEFINQFSSLRIQKIDIKNKIIDISPVFNKIKRFVNTEIQLNKITKK